jgi:hypothetical protein
MTILIELDPDTEARLMAEAGSRGLRIQDYAYALIREGLPSTSNGAGQRTPKDFQKISEQMTKWSHKIPVLAPEATERESFYERP